MPTTRIVQICASVQLQNMYKRNLPLLRLQWLEIQNDVVEMKGYTVDRLPLQKADLARGTPITRLGIRQTRWESHVMPGTVVLLNKDLMGQQVADVVRVGDNTTAVITVDRVMEPSDISTIHIVHGGERLTQVMEHLSLGRRLLQRSTPRKGGWLFCDRYFGLPEFERKEVDAFFASEELHARQGEPKRDRDISQAKWKRQRGAYARHQRAARQSIDTDMAGDLYQSLNDEQKACLTSGKQFISCLGYPGTGKTRNLAAMVLFGFRRLLLHGSGWFVCVTNSNAAALNLLTKLLEYPSLRPWVRHKYSRMFKAFHPLQFADFAEYRVTPNMKLAPHGIMVCTIGSLAALCRKYSTWTHQVFDLVIDEAGQLWDFDFLLLLSRFPKLKRCSLFDDGNQLPAYISRLLRDSTKNTGSALDVPSCSDLCKFVKKLVVQYRAVPALCRVHAPVFYPYEIRSHREPNLTRGGPSKTLPYQGYYYCPLPRSQKGLGGQSLVQYEVDRALEIYQHIRDEKRVSPVTGKEYTICILTQYTETLRYLLQSIHAKNIQGVTISTVQTIQGCEVDVTIYMSSRTAIRDLNLCRHRGNVACSRAREYTVLMATPRAVTSSCLDESDMHPLHYWGELLVEAAAFWEGDGPAARVLTKVRRLLFFDNYDLFFLYN